MHVYELSTLPFLFSATLVLHIEPTHFILTSMNIYLFSHFFIKKTCRSRFTLFASAPRSPFLFAP